jgi:hypothetical protein
LVIDIEFRGVFNRTCGTVVQAVVSIYSWVDGFKQLIAGCDFLEPLCREGIVAHGVGRGISLGGGEGGVRGVEERRCPSAKKMHFLLRTEHKVQFNEKRAKSLQ